MVGFELTISLTGVWVWTVDCGTTRALREATHIVDFAKTFFFWSKILPRLSNSSLSLSSFKFQLSTHGYPIIFLVWAINF